jgi:hypothetical protein
MGRHGRKNRRLLRAWKFQNIPEFRARLEAKPDAHLDEDGRPLKYSDYADRHLLVLTGGDQHDPVLRWMHHDEIAERNAGRNWISRIMTMRFGRDPDLAQRCWYTGVLLYLVPYEIRERLGRMVPWECSREHLVCERNGGYGNGNGNIVIAGRYFNKKVGHSPLPVKLLIRQELAKREYDRNRPTWAAMAPVLDHTINIENEHKLGDHYPWQPWAFEPGTRDRRIADAFHREMLEAEREFLSLDDEEKGDWLESFTWRW